MTVLAALTAAGFLSMAVVGVRRVRRADALLRRLVSQDGARTAVDRATHLGLINPPPPRRWALDQKDLTPVRRVLHDMPHH